MSPRFWVTIPLGLSSPLLKVVRATSSMPPQRGDRAFAAFSTRGDCGAALTPASAHGRRSSTPPLSGAYPDRGGVALNLSGTGEGQYRYSLITPACCSPPGHIYQHRMSTYADQRRYYWRAPTISTGNVMADDTAPTGTTVTAIANAGGVEYAGRRGRRWIGTIRHAAH